MIYKLAKVIPIFQKGDKLDANNYRPISLSSFSKVFEKVNYKHLFAFFDKHSVLVPINMAFNQMDQQHMLF